MSRIKWYKRDPLAALDGMMILTLEERGAYNTVLDLIYAREGKVIDDDRFLAGWMRCDVRVWKRIRERLIELGKLQTSNGLLTNLRATSEVSEALSYSELNRSNIRKRWSKHNENKDLVNTTVCTESIPSTTTTTTTTTEEDKKETRASALTQGWPPDYFEKFWLAYPEKVAKPRAKKALEKVMRGRDATFDELMAGLDRYKKTKPATRDWAHPASWINAARWADQPASQLRIVNGGRDAQVNGSPLIAAADQLVADARANLARFSGEGGVCHGAGPPPPRPIPPRGGE